MLKGSLWFRETEVALKDAGETGPFRILDHRGRSDGQAARCIVQDSARGVVDLTAHRLGDSRSPNLLTDPTVPVRQGLVGLGPESLFVVPDRAFQIVAGEECGKRPARYQDGLRNMVLSGLQDRRLGTRQHVHGVLLGPETW
jgi:hypothetical protein